LQLTNPTQPTNTHTLMQSAFVSRQFTEINIEKHSKVLVNASKKSSGLCTSFRTQIVSKNSKKRQYFHSLTPINNYAHSQYIN